MDAKDNADVVVVVVAVGVDVVFGAAVVVLLLTLRCSLRCLIRPGTFFSDLFLCF